MQQFRVFRAIGLGFKTWFRNFIPITLLAAIVYTPVIAWLAVADPHKATSVDELVRNYFQLPIYVLVGLSALLSPMLTYRIVKDLDGQQVSILTSIQYGLRGIIPAIILAGVTAVLGFVPAGGILGAIITCYWFVAAPAAVAEKLGPVAALSRSAQLTAGRRGGIFGLTFLLGLALVIAVMVYVAPMVQHPDRGDPFAQIKHAALFMAIAVAIFQAFIGIVQAVSYALLRQDKDGVSHEELARVFE